MTNSQSSRSVSRLYKSLALTMTLGCSPTVPDHPSEACKTMAVGDLVVTEFMADPAGSDTGKQYIEVYNATDHTIDLNGLSLFQSMADGSRLKAIALHGSDITPHAYFVLSDTGDTVDARPGYVNYGYGNALGALRHENGKLGLRCASTVIAEIAYTQVTAGHACELDGTTIANVTARSDDSSWCDATEPLRGLAPEGENFGSPGTANPACPKSPTKSPDSGANSSRPAGSGGAPSDIADAGATCGQCLDALTGARRAPRKPLIGDLVVSEIMPAPSTGNNGSGEWFEVFARRDVDLNGLELANEGTGSTVLTSDACMSAKAGDWLLFARGNDTAQNGGLPSPVATFDFNLADSSSSTYAERAVVVRIDGSEVDRATWTRTTKGASLQRSQTSLGSADNAASSFWCITPADHTFGASDRGTPGAANTSCPSDIADAGSIQNEPADASVGGAPSFVNTGSSKPVASGGAAAGAAASGGAPAYPGTGTTSPRGSGGAASGGAPTSANTADTKPSASGGAASGGVPATIDAGSNRQCRDAAGVVRDPVAPQTGDLVITEVMSAPSQNNNGTGEWFEVLVNADIDLNGLELANEGTGGTLLESESCFSVKTGERLLFARSAVSTDNGGLSFVTAVFDFTVADSSSSTHPERAIVLRHADFEISRATWTKSTKGASWQLSAGARQADAGRSFTDAGSDPGQWCVTPTGITFGLGDRGTPGIENTFCP